MFDLPDSWVWDYWFADDGEQYHLFFLYASRALHDPELRHHRASVGHAVSTDLVTWERIADALVRSDAPAFDDLATWTGSVVRRDDGTWVMFYTGASLDPSGLNVQTVGSATSTDLVRWTKTDGPLLGAAAPHYEKLDAGAWHDEAFRDPWVFRDPDGDGWHMLVTARAATGDVFGRGVVGHATSPDLDEWTLREPLSTPSADGFGQLEVLQVEVVDGRPVLIFSCAPEHASEARRGARGGTWAVPADSVTGPFDISRARPLTDETLYVGRLLRRREDGQWLLFAFRNADENGDFVGGVIDPMPVAWRGDRLVAGGAPSAGVPTSDS